MLTKKWYFVSYGSLAHKYILSISGWFLIKLNNGCVFPDPKPRMINILHGWSGIRCQFGLFCFMFFITSSKSIISCISWWYPRVESLLFNLLDLCSFHLHMFLLNQLISFFHHNLNLKSIFLVSSVKTCLSLLNLYCVFNKDLLVLMNCLCFF